MDKKNIRMVNLVIIIRKYKGDFYNTTDYNIV